MALTKATHRMIEGASVNVKDYGAVGDGVTDDTAAFLAAKAVCSADNLTFFVPDGDYYIPSGIDLWGLHKLDIIGGLHATDSAQLFIVGSHATDAQLDTYYIRGVSPGTLQIKGMEAGVVDLGSVDILHLYAHGYDDGLGGPYHAIAYSTFSFQAANELRLECDKDGGVTAWMNENTFHCGHCSEVNFIGDYTMNNNIFYSLRIEGGLVNIDKGNHNYFYNVRLEGTNTFTFGSTTFNNIFIQTWANFTDVAFDDRDAATWNVTDNGKNNDIIAMQETYITRKVLHEITPVSRNYPWSLFESDNTQLTIKATYNTFYDTGLVKAETPMWFLMNTDSTSFNIFLEAYDASGTQITTEPNSEFTGGRSGGWAWDGTNNWYHYGGAVLGDAGFSVYPAKDTAVKFFRVTVRTAGSTIGDTLTYWRMLGIQKVENPFDVGAANFKGDKRGGCSGTTAPTYGTFEVGDIIFNETPAASGNIGWVCVTAGTPGTWKTYGTIAT